MVIAFFFDDQSNKITLLRLSGEIPETPNFMEKRRMKKYDLYEEMIRRLDVAVQNGQFFEASWYAYAVLEDRLNSMLNSSGFGSPIRMMGSKSLTRNYLA